MNIEKEKYKVEIYSIYDELDTKNFLKKLNETISLKA